MSDTALAVLNQEWTKVRPIELSIVLAEDTFVQKLNMTYRDRSVATNVLSFPAFGNDPVRDALAAGDAPVLLGDVVLAFETCEVEAQAREGGVSFDDHVRHLLVHGILHLLGYDHTEDIAAIKMETREKQILAGFGVADPYY